MTLNRTFLGGTAVFAALLASSVALAPRPLAAADPLKLCFEPWAPFTIARGGQPEGAVIDILKAVGAPAGFAITFEEMPYARCLAGVLDGSYDGMPATSDEPDLVTVGPPVAYWMIGVFVNQSWPGERWQKLEEFAGKTVGLQAGYTSFGEKVDPHIEGKTGWKVERSPDVLNLRKVGAGRIDLTIADAPNSLVVVKTEKLAVRLLPPMVDARPQTVMLSKTSAAAKGPRLAAALTALKSSGGFDGPYIQHLLIPWSEHETQALAAIGRK